MIVQEISASGTSIWLDDLSRSKITALDPHSLPHRIAHDGVVGVTTNPSIFSSAISQEAEYAADIASLRHLPAIEVVRKLTTDDVRSACDLFTRIHQESGGIDGRVSIEVDPRSARDSASTIAEGEQLWKIINRPNLLIKVPATLEGLPAITELISLGISVNVTLIFSVSRYVQVMDAYMSGLEKRLSRGGKVNEIASVASFFISRIDSAVDTILKTHSGGPSHALLGKAAIANAALAYEAFQQQCASSRWLALKKAGARVQRPLWASTGVKDPTYDDTRYVMELLERNCVNTMPQATLDAVIDHGKMTQRSLSSTYNQAHEVIRALSTVGICLDSITDALEIDGVTKFAQSWNELLANVESALKG